MSQLTLRDSARAFAMLAIGLYVLLWLMSFMGHGTTYPNGTPAASPFRPYLTGLLAVAVSLLAVMALRWSPGQANQ